MNAREDGWLGYATDGSRNRLNVRDLGDRVLLLGRGAPEMATLFAFAAAEGGLNYAVLDLDGSIAEGVQGYHRCSDYRSLLYEAFHLEGEDAAHGQLVASAYAAALDLTTEEESILSASLQVLSEQNDLAAPAALYEVVGAAEGFRGFYVDKLKGRIGALKHLDSTRADDFQELMRGGSLVTFASAPYPRAADLAACVCIAKMLYLLARQDVRPDALMLTGAHRLFRALTRYQHSGKLIAHLLEARIPLILSSPLPAFLNDRLSDSMSVRVYSSEAWNSRRGWKRAPAPPSSYTVCDDRSGRSFGFAPRFIRPRRNTAAGVPFPSRASSELTRTILEEISRYDAANRQSVVSYLAPDFLPADVGAEIDRLHSGGYLVMEPKRDGPGPRVLAYTVTEAGRRLLRELSG